MATNLLGIPTSNVFVPYTAATKRTKEVTISITSAQTGWSTVRCVGVFYADSAGSWRLSFNLVATFSDLSAGAKTITATMPNVVFHASATRQALALSTNTTTVAARAYVTGNGSDITVVISEGNTITGFQVSGDVELNTEPTAYTIAANMEGVLPVDVFIPPASASISGLLDYRDNILCKYYGSTSSPGTSSPAVIKFDTKKYETYSSDCYSPSTGFFTAPRAGYYRFSFALISGSENYTTGSGFNVYIFTNSSSPTKVSLISSAYAQTTYSASRLGANGSITIYLAAGGTAAIYALTPGGTALDLTTEEHNWLCIERVGF